MARRRGWRPLGAPLLFPLLAMLGLLAGAPGPGVAAEPTGERVRVATERLEVVLALDGGRPVTWRACRPSTPILRRSAMVNFLREEDCHANEDDYD